MYYEYFICNDKLQKELPYLNTHRMQYNINHRTKYTPDLINFQIKARENNNVYDVECQIVCPQNISRETYESVN